MDRRYASPTSPADSGSLARRCTATFPMPTPCSWPAGCVPSTDSSTRLHNTSAASKTRSLWWSNVLPFGVENLSGDPQLESLLTARNDGEAITSLSSDTAISVCLSAFHQFDVDWKLHGFDTHGLRELAEMTLRTVQSMLTDPGQEPRKGLALRRFVARWLGPAILYARITSLSIHEQDTTFQYGSGWVPLGLPHSRLEQPAPALSPDEQRLPAPSAVRPQ